MSRNRKQRGSDGKQPPRKRKLVVDGSDDDDEDFMAENSQDEEDGERKVYCFTSCNIFLMQSGASINCFLS